MKDKLCLSPAEACKELGIGRTKFYAMLKKGEIPHLRVGARILIPTRALESWIEFKMKEETNNEKEA